MTRLATFLMVLTAGVRLAQVATPPAAFDNWPITNSVLALTDPNAANQVVAWDDTNNKFVWVTVSAGGGGTVTSFSAGGLSPIFTTSEATVTTTPALSFTLRNAAAHTFLGNNTGSTAAPAYVAVADSDLSTTDITTNNATTSKHGFLPKLNGSTTQFLNGNGAFTTPVGGGSGTVTNPANLTTNGVILGGTNGTTDVKTVSGFTTDGTSKLTLGG